MNILKSLKDIFTKPKQIDRPDGNRISIANIKDRWATYPADGLTPQKLAIIFKNADAGDILQQVELYEQMEERDPALFGNFDTRKMALIGLEWNVKPFDDSPKAVEIAEFCENALLSLNFDNVIFGVSDAIAKGISLHEIMWDVSSGQAVPSSIDWVHQKKLTFWNSLEPMLLTDAEPTNGIELPENKFLYYCHKTRSGYDTRAGLMRILAWFYLFKNYAVKDWCAFAEIYGQPLRLGKYEVGTPKDDRDALLAAVRSIGTDAAGIISKSTEIEFVQAANMSTGESVYAALAKFCDSQYSKAILGQDSSEVAGGLTGLETWKRASVRHDLLESDASQIGNYLTQSLLKPIAGFNFGWDAWEKFKPQFLFNYEESEDLGKLATTYKTLKDMGYPFSVEYLSERFKIPMFKDGETPLGESVEDIQEPIQKRQPDESGQIQNFELNEEEQQQQQELKKILALKIVKPDSLISQQKEIDELAIQAANETNQVLDDAMSQIIEIMKSADNYDDAVNLVMTAFPLATFSRITEMISMALFTAKNIGKASNNAK